MDSSYFAPARVSVSVCLFVCLYVSLSVRISQTPHAQTSWTCYVNMFFEISIVNCGRGSVLLCDKLCTSGYIDDVVFSYNEPHGVWRWRYRRGRRAAACSHKFPTCSPGDATLFDIQHYSSVLSLFQCDFCMQRLTVFRMAKSACPCNSWTSCEIRAVRMNTA